MSDIAKAVGQRIRNYRTKKGFSQAKLAEMIERVKAEIAQEKAKQTLE